MSLNLENKKVVVAQISEILKPAQTIVIAEYAGVTVSAMTSIRKQAREANVYLHVVKNTLASLAVADTKFSPLAKQMTGQLIYSISEDPIAAAKIINEFAKANDKVKIRAGMYNDKLLDVNGVKQLAQIPSRNELLSMVMGVMKEIPTSFVRCVAAIQAKQEQQVA